MTAASPAPSPPADPRADWDLPAFGSMPPVVEVEEGVTRVLAANPSPMTLDGTNTYVLSRPGSGAALVVDPGPEDPAHRRQVERVIDERDAEVVGIVLTHHHLDHAEAAATWAADHGCPVHAWSSSLASDGAQLRDGDPLPSVAIDAVAVATPGHTRDHLAVRLASGSVLTGDHILGRGTSVVAHPDGDLAAYLDSLARLLDLGVGTLHPGHGPSMGEDPTAVLRYYHDHRRFREAQLLHSIEVDGPAGTDELVARLYADVDRRVWPAAAASLNAAVTMLVDQGRLRRDGEGRCHLDV